MCDTIIIDCDKKEKQTEKKKEKEKEKEKEEPGQSQWTSESSPQSKGGEKTPNGKPNEYEDLPHPFLFVSLFFLSFFKKKKLIHQIEESAEDRPTKIE